MPETVHVALSAATLTAQEVATCFLRGQGRITPTVAGWALVGIVMTDQVTVMRRYWTFMPPASVSFAPDAAIVAAMAFTMPRDAHVTSATLPSNEICIAADATRVTSDRSGRSTPSDSSGDNSGSLWPL